MHTSRVQHALGPLSGRLLLALQARHHRGHLGRLLLAVGLLRGAISPDGKTWTFLDEPLLDVGRSGLDSQNIAAYDPDAGRYVAYLRGHQDRRRIVRRSEGNAFRGWSPPRGMRAA